MIKETSRRISLDIEVGGVIFSGITVITGVPTKESWEFHWSAYVDTVNGVKVPGYPILRAVGKEDTFHYETAAATRAEKELRDMAEKFLAYVVDLYITGGCSG